MSNKLQTNIDIITLLKKIEGEGRPATPEEKALLVKYVGWGALDFAFDKQSRYGQDGYRWSHKNDFDRVYSLLTPEEWRAAADSVFNAHYTSEVIINGMWSAVKRLGFKGGLVTEPSGGIGHFFGLMPGDLAARSKRVLVEKDSITGRIARLLYPGTDVRIQGFEDANLPSNMMDLHISNVPFGNVRVFDQTFAGDRSYLRQSIHDYFFAKSLDRTRPGGLVAFVTSSFTADKATPRVREYLAKNSELLGMIRLPNNAFLDNAGTKVTTDIIFLRKLLPGEKPMGEKWLDVVNMKDANGVDYPLNEYFVRHPEMLLGRMEVLEHGGTAGKMQPSLLPTGDLAEQLAAAIDRLPADVMTPRGVSADIRTLELSRNANQVKVGGIEIKLENGKRVVYQTGRDGIAVPLEKKLGDGQVDRIEEMLRLRDMMNEMVAEESTGMRDAANWRRLQARLNKAYDGFVGLYGAINDPKNKRLLDGDPDVYRLMALDRKSVV